jgi:hypothetical protein
LHHEIDAAPVVVNGPSLRDRQAVEENRRRACAELGSRARESENGKVMDASAISDMIVLAEEIRSYSYRGTSRRHRIITSKG